MGPTEAPGPPQVATAWLPPQRPVSRGGSIPRTLVVADKFPPRLGGIQQYVANLLARLPAEQIVVCAPAREDDAAAERDYDAALPYPVVRLGGSWLPTPTLARRLREVAHAEGCVTAWFGTAAPLALLGNALRPGGIEHVVASTHGHEVGWSRLPAVGPSGMRRIGSVVDVITYLGPFTRPRLAQLVGPQIPLVRLPGGVDPDRFRPDCGGDEVRARLGLDDRPVVVSVSRLVRRKGQDTLIRAWPGIRARCPEAQLLIVGHGVGRRRLERLADASGVTDSVVFTGAVAAEELAAHYDAGDVFAMPCRTRLAGIEAEGLGIANLEAAATGLPVITGASGGAPDAVLSGHTGQVVDGRDRDALTDAVVDLLVDRDRARAWGVNGRAWVERRWHWDALAARMGNLLAGVLPDDDPDDLPLLPHPPAADPDAPVGRETRDDGAAGGPVDRETRADSVPRAAGPGGGR
ncbi:MAG: glycosyltransferase family 4 protein, partial [Frankia sp.]